MKHIQLFQKKVIERNHGIPYLIRWNLFGLGRDSSLFSIKVHKILVSDDACMHDHPWAFLSVILKGGYIETANAADVQAGENGWTYSRFCRKSRMMTTWKYINPGSIIYRPANWAHRLDIDPENPCWTLVFTFRKVKTWGFFTPGGWKHWSRYSKDRDC